MKSNMNSIYNIYERLYNGLLAGMDDTMSRGDKVAMNIYNSFKEKLIRIVHQAGQLSDQEIVTFRSIINDMMRDGYHYAVCPMPSQLQSSLIAASKRKLSKHDFAGFLTSKKEYDFRCSLEYMHLDSCAPNTLNTHQLIDELRSHKNRFKILNKKVRTIALGNAIIYQEGRLMYITIDETYRIIIRTTDYPIGCSINLNAPREEE